MANVLSVREPGELAAHDVADLGSEQDRDALRLVILIHGYHNSQDKAGRSFRAFRSSLKSVMRGREHLLGTFWEFHWPGDHVDRLTSLRTFPVRVGAARASGDLLARFWLADRSPDQSVTLIAHSLGCRVALEAVKSILQEQERGRYHGARIERVFLLAAAVPTTLCLPRKSFHERYPGSTDHTFYSARDRALGLVFAAGSHEVGEDGPAVGRDGMPIERWTSRHDTNLPHKRYWPSLQVATDICDISGVLTWRPLPRQPLVSVRPDDDGPQRETHDLPEIVPMARLV